jgi:hypothetical protein
MIKNAREYFRSFKDAGSADVGSRSQQHHQFLTVLEGTVSINNLLAFLPPVVPVV